MPFHRLARLVSTPYKRFTSTELVRYFQFIARRLLPLYVHLGMSLADAPVISGDDTSSKVLLVKKALKEKEQDPNAPMPWDDYATPEKAQRTIHQQETARNKAIDERRREARATGGASGKKSPPLPPSPSLTARAAAVFGFVSPRKDGTGHKITFNTTVLTGRMDPDDPKSTVIFYRSHLGSVGNLLDVILAKRKRHNRALVVQTDLSTTNLIKDEIRKDFDIQYVGCAAHARRPFKLHSDDEPELCDPILYYFKGLTIYDNRIELLGRNETNTLAVRQVEHRSMWKQILHVCNLLTSKWSPKTELGRAARYIIRHYEKLTYYLNDARVAATNNFVERMLRMEKLIAKNALFRKSLDGRCALDIIRTVLQTAIAAGVNPAGYLRWVLRMPEEALANDPGAFAPLAYAEWLKESAEGDVAA